jgi:hypothetical protein
VGFGVVTGLVIGMVWCGVWCGDWYGVVTALDTDAHNGLDILVCVHFCACVSASHEPVSSGEPWYVLWAQTIFFEWLPKSRNRMDPFLFKDLTRDIFILRPILGPFNESWPRVL